MLRNLALLIGGVAALACQQYPAGAKDRSGDEAAKVTERIDDRLVAANNRFGLKLLRQLAAPELKNNIFISPSSVAMALTMTYNGAAGATREAMAGALEFSGMSLNEIDSAAAALRGLLENPDPKVRLSIANSLWARTGIPFDSTFLARNREFFAARITNLDFSRPDAAGTINAWVKDKTEGRIPNIVAPPINPLTIMFLINAIYFKGIWTYRFDAAATHDRPFHLADGGTRNAPFMNQAGEYRYLATDDFQAVCLPYGSERLGMYIFFPGAQVGLPEFVRRLNASKWQEWMNGFAKAKGTIALPRFALQYEKPLRETLTALGMGIAFSDQADFSALTNLPVAITEVKHKTFMEVNEEGTEAAAATSVEIGVTSMRPGSPFEMVVDRPFLCAIRDNTTGAVLFVGAIVDPT